MRWSLLLISVAVGIGSTARAQQPGSPAWDFPERYYQPPGVYGMAWGSASYGQPLGYSRFNSPFRGGGYGYGLKPYSLAPGPFGQGLWNPGAGAGDPRFGFTGYRTFAAPGWPGTPPPPVGAFAPAFGPPAYHLR
jgi:hypothetical protein